MRLLLDWLLSSSPLAAQTKKTTKDLCYILPICHKSCISYTLTPLLCLYDIYTWHLYIFSCIPMLQRCILRNNILDMNDHINHKAECPQWNTCRLSILDLKFSNLSKGHVTAFREYMYSNSFDWSVYWCKLSLSNNGLNSLYMAWLCFNNT